MIVGAIAIAVTAVKEAEARSDERDRAIARRGATIGYYVLIAGMILVGVVMPFSEPPWKIVNTALLTIVLAETAHQAVVLLSIAELAWVSGASPTRSGPCAFTRAR